MLNTKAHITVIALACLSVACTRDQAPPVPPPPVNNVVLKEIAPLGQVLTDSAGRTLYFYTRDTTGNSVCSGGCRDTWPIFYTTTLRLGAGLAAADFGTITRPDGAKQNTYKGWPLYYYKTDAAAGEAKGENVGKVWFVAKPDYTIMLMNGPLIGNNGKQYTSTYVEGVEIVQYFTDANGRTLYGFKNDKNNVNKYTKEDFSNNPTWPIYEVAELKKVPTGVAAADFAVINVFTKKQLTYKGWPLYYFGADAGLRGKTKGVSVPTPGVWPIVNQQTVVAPQ